MDENDKECALRVKCSNLSTLPAGGSLLCVLEIKNEVGRYVEAGRTERLPNIGPEWVSPLIVKLTEVDAEVELKFKVYQVGLNEDLNDSLCIGVFAIGLQRIFGKKNNLIKKKLKAGNGISKQTGEIQVKAFEVNKDCLDKFTFLFEASRLQLKKQKKARLFYELSSSFGKETIVTYRSSKTVYDKKSKKFTWPQETVETRYLCNASTRQPIRVSFYAETDGEVIFFGSFDTCVQELLEKSWCDIKLKTKKKLRKVGNLNVRNKNLQRRFPFYKYAQADNCEISLMIGIDFTASNKPFTNTKSLHYINPDWRKGIEYMNPYQTVIETLGNIFIVYDKDHKVPVFGFGGKFYGEKKSSLDYPLNKDEADAEVEGIEGVLEVYEDATRAAEFHEPTKIGPIITKALEDIDAKEGNNNYHILLIITDGDYNDVDHVAELLLANADKPLTTIIVGVGDGGSTKFKHMDLFAQGRLHEELDQPKPKIIPATQFIKFNDYKEQYKALKQVAKEKVGMDITEYFARQCIYPDGARSLRKYDGPNASLRHMGSKLRIVPLEGAPVVDTADYINPGGTLRRAKTQNGSKKPLKRTSTYEEQPIPAAPVKQKKKKNSKSGGKRSDYPHYPEAIPISEEQDDNEEDQNII